jgi:Raf kinase inhibitor-like YbhB/YbcL family protein
MIRTTSLRLFTTALGLAASLTGADAFELTSPDVGNDQAIPQKFAFDGFGCTGENLSPALAWRDPPVGTKSFAIFVHDPDAKTGGAGFWHWIAIDIPAATNTLIQGAGKRDNAALPAGARQIASDFGTSAYGGPCPPPGDKPHHYVFTVYALSVEKLAMPENPTASLTGFMTNLNALASASFTATYGR